MVGLIGVRSATDSPTYALAALSCISIWTGNSPRLILTIGHGQCVPPVLEMHLLAHDVQAEAFAALVLMDFVSIAGATQTIVTLLKKPDNRCAAITMLGKTIELCSDQVRTMRFSCSIVAEARLLSLLWLCETLVRHCKDDA